MAIEVKHREFVISFNEQEELWCCPDLNISEPKLSTVKRRIDAIGKSERTIDINAYMYSRRWRDDKMEIETVRVTVLCDPEAVRYRSSSETTHCWITREKGKNRGDRCKVRVDQLVPMEERADLMAWMRLEQETDRARTAADKARENLTHHTAESLLLASKEQHADDKPKRTRKLKVKAA